VSYPSSASIAAQRRHRIDRERPVPFRTGPNSTAVVIAREAVAACK
jgi:hypothetical protein